MIMRIDEVRRFALSLPEATEEPHFRLASFRVKGKIFATVTPDEKFLHVFVDADQRDRMLATEPQAYEKLWWGKQVAGLRVILAKASPGDVKGLLQSAWQRKAPKSLARKKS